MNPSLIRPYLWQIVAIVVAGATSSVMAGDIAGRRENMFGVGQHETFIYAVGTGANSTSAHGIGFSWLGNYTISGLPAGQYHIASGETFAYFYNILNNPVTVPASGTLNLYIQDFITMDSQGLGDLGPCQWAAQTFVATGHDLGQFSVLSPTGGKTVTATIREGDPFGPQIGPSRIINLASLFPSLPRFAPGEVPLVPGRTYALRFDGHSTWTMSISSKPDPFPNGEAWIDGLRLPETDLAVSIQCRDKGFVDGYRVSNWWRANTYTEYVQTFIARGTDLRIASLMVAGPGGEHLMRASVHQWPGSYPYGAQIGPTKHARMGENVFHAFVWGPNEVPLTPGVKYAIRYQKVDNQPFAIYGDSDNVPGVEAYFDGVPDSGIDMSGRLVFTEEDLGDVNVGNLSFQPISATQIRATFTTDVPAVATVRYQKGSPVFSTIKPTDGAESTSHDIVVDHLDPGSTYQMWIMAYNLNRNVTETLPVNVLTPTTTAMVSGAVGGQRGLVAGAEVKLLPQGTRTTTDGDGYFQFNNVPTGKHTLRVESMAQKSVEQEIDVPPSGLIDVGMNSATYTTVYSTSQTNPFAGWTPFGHFNGEFDTGSYSINARTGTKWMGYVTNWPGAETGVHGGIYRTISVQPGVTYRLAGFTLTKAFGASYDPIDGAAVARLGVDLSGGTDPNSSGVKWSRYRFTSGEWMEHVVEFTATGSQATIFARHKSEHYNDYTPWFIAAYDDIWVGVPATPLPDFDNDNDIDLDDFGMFQACIQGPGIEVTDPQCLRGRLDGDDDIDSTDVQKFIGCLSGANIPLDADCIQP